MTAIEQEGPANRPFFLPPIWRRSLWAWLAMACAMTANGVFRELALKRWLDDRQASIASAGLGITLVQVIASRAFGRSPATSREQLAEIAGTWLVLTLAFEFTFGHWVDHKSWTELAANYNVLRGRLWPVVLATIVAAPFIWGRPRQERMSP